jgi:Tol biopolymer transport system component
MRILPIILLFTYAKNFSQLPKTELFLANIEIKNNLIKVKSAEKISNRIGYNNQPSFINKDEEILFTSDIEGDSKTHICNYNISAKKIKRLSITNTSEYSAQLLPNKKDFSVVMVEEDSTQRIWVFDLLKGENKSCLSQQTDSIGY